MECWFESGHRQKRGEAIASPFSFLPVKKRQRFAVFRTRNEGVSRFGGDRIGPRKARVPNASFGNGVTGHAPRVPAEGESGHRPLPRASRWEARRASLRLPPISCLRQQQEVERNISLSRVWDQALFCLDHFARVRKMVFWNFKNLFRLFPSFKKSGAQ